MIPSVSFVTFHSPTLYESRRSGILSLPALSKSPLHSSLMQEGREKLPAFRKLLLLEEIRLLSFRHLRIFCMRPGLIQPLIQLSGKHQALTLLQRGFFRRSLISVLLRSYPMRLSTKIFHENIAELI
ncbi:MYB DNA-binding domain-containing protein [Histoplasma capsulatum]|uniref:MYB DNA-binding domain-containing protein n=1 Tax=Ajellomyces capsulatus TaxID=5037 RepID=A0A8A1MC73_AJECA|nr:MYB DNA-binding domain-containing protein [Histoplasma capsulatum]